jgi:hypothetical protein
MQPKKKLLRPDRIRKPPSEGWSWMDRRFLREKAPSLERDAIYLYFFLAAVSDKDGLSYWSDPSIAGCLRMSEEAVRRAREELEFQDLIAFDSPHYQVLSIPKAPPQRKASEPTLLVDIFREIAKRVATDTPSPRKGDSP